MPLRVTIAFADPSSAAKPLHVLRPEDLALFLTGPGAAWAGWLKATGFEATLGELRLLPAPDGGVAGAVVGFGSAQARRRARFGLAKAVPGLPAGNWTLAGKLSRDEATEAADGLIGGWDTVTSTVRTFSRARPRNTSRTSELLP